MTTVMQDFYARLCSKRPYRPRAPHGTLVETPEVLSDAQARQLVLGAINGRLTSIFEVWDRTKMLPREQQKRCLHQLIDSQEIELVQETEDPRISNAVIWPSFRRSNAWEATS